MYYRSAAIAALLCAACASPAAASVYSDDLARCLVKSTSDKDKTGLIRWLFGAMASSPAVKDLVNASPEQRTTLNRNAAELVQRLLLVDCRTETATAIKYDGVGTIESSFGLLGQVAMRDLMNDSSVTTEL